MRILAKDTVDSVNKPVVLMGWVNSRRDHGGLIFIDLRDESGLVQLTCTPDDAALFAVAETLRNEYVLRVEGTVVERGDDLVNPNIATGKVEVVASVIEILNKSDVLPFQIDDSNVGEETRLKYRYLDLRREKMQNTLKQRSVFNRLIHEYMHDLDFVEVSTPILANSSPEGARDYLVPSRLHPGKFYALPQAPQQFKQLLMVGGVPRYYQLAACFRDEDPRADRHPGEFYQLDLECAFIEDGEQIRTMMDPLIVKLATEFAGKKLAYEGVPRLGYEEVMDRFGSDKPDLRYGVELVDLSEELAGCEFGVFSKVIADGGNVKAICVPGGASLSRSKIDTFTDKVKQLGAGGLPYITIKNGEPVSAITKFFSPEQLATIVSKMDAKEGDCIFFGSDKRSVVNKVLGQLRIAMAQHFELIDEDLVALLWVVDFPFYEYDEKAKKVDFGHNPFSMPKGGLEVLDGASDSDLLEIAADQYDMVMNGFEICSGAVRNHNPEIMYKAFGNLGFDEAYVDEKFGAMIGAFKMGAPPHGGCAFGLDRIFMVLMGEPNIREVIAFPKNGSAIDAMTGAPTLPEQYQLEDLHLQVVETEE